MSDGGDRGVFPCDFHLKVMGRTGGGFAANARGIVEAHVGELADEAVRSRPSRDGRFVSLTFSFRAASREQLDALYRELSADESVLMVL